MRALAYKSRQDYQNLQNQAVEYKALHGVYRSERLPTLELQQLLRHQHRERRGHAWRLLAVGTLNFPIFREAKLRGDADASKRRWTQ